MRYLILPLLVLLCATAAFSQEQTAKRGTPAATAAAPADPFTAQFIPRNSKVFIGSFESESTEKPVTGFATYLNSL